MSGRPIFSRRGFIGGGLALGVPMAVAAAPARSVGALLDPHQAEDFALISRKVRFRTDDGLTFAWLFGTKYGQVGGELRPLMNMEAGSISRVRNTANGFEVTALERTFYTDLTTRKRLTKWVNPYTGETIPITRGPVGPTTVRYRADGTRELPTEFGGAKFEGRSDTLLVSAVGDDIWISNDSTVKLTRDNGAGNAFHVTEWSISHARLSEVSPASVRGVESRIHLQEVTSWPIWMRMGEQPGVVTSRGVGIKVLEFERLPATWREMLAQTNPEIARDPARALDRPPARFEQ